jgi:GAF domain-containing protein
MGAPVIAVGPGSPEPEVRWRARLAALLNAGLAEQPDDEQFDRVTAMVGRLLRVPVSVVSLIETERQVIASEAGKPGRRETPLTHSFCQYVVASDAPLQVSDAREDPIVRDNLAVTDFGVIAYLGFPLRAAGNVTVGSLCAVDSKPRAWTSDDFAVLKDLAALVEGQIALREKLRARTLPGLRAVLQAMADELAAPVAPVRALAFARAVDPGLPPAVRSDFAAIEQALASQARILGELQARAAEPDGAAASHL